MWPFSAYLYWFGLRIDPRVPPERAHRRKACGASSGSIRPHPSPSRACASRSARGCFRGGPGPRLARDARGGWVGRCCEPFFAAWSRPGSERRLPQRVRVRARYPSCAARRRGARRTFTVSSARVSRVVAGPKRSRTAASGAAPATVLEAHLLGQHRAGASRRADVFPHSACLHPRALSAIRARSGFSVGGVTASSQRSEKLCVAT